MGLPFTTRMFYVITFPSSSLHLSGCDIASVVLRPEHVHTFKTAGTYLLGFSLLRMENLKILSEIDFDTVNLCFETLSS